MGGMARRAWIIQKIAGAFPGVPVLKLDSGNFRDAPTPAGDARTNALLRAMQLLGYQVSNVAERDVDVSAGADGADSGIDRAGQRAEEQADDQIAGPGPPDGGRPRDRGRPPSSMVPPHGYEYTLTRHGVQHDRPTGSWCGSSPREHMITI